MLSIRDLILLEDLDADNLYWKINMWFGRQDHTRTPFWTVMQQYIDTTPPMNQDDLHLLLNSHGIDWRSFVQFAMDNIDGTQEFDQLYTMKRIMDILKNNKHLKWDL